MIGVLTHKNYLQMPWANGLGLTAEIDIYSAHALVSDKRFLWRLSSATVLNSGPFSFYPGFKRLLLVTEGAGLVLNGTLLKSGQIFHFSGDTAIHADLVSGPVTDVGLIYDPNSIDASATVLRFAKSPANVANNEASVTVNLSVGTHYFYAINARFQCKGFFAEPKDTLKICMSSIAAATSSQFELTSSSEVCEVLHLILDEKKPSRS